MTVDRIESKTDILIDAIALGTILIDATDHRTLDGITFHHSNAALVTAGVTAVAVKCTGSVGFVNPTVRIGGFHSIAFF